MFVILASSGDRRVTVYGNGDGQPYKSERNANGAMRRLASNYPRLDFIVLPIAATDALMLRTPA